jgi:hypothetical protein
MRPLLMLLVCSTSARSYTTSIPEVGHATPRIVAWKGNYQSAQTNLTHTVTKIAQTIQIGEVVLARYSMICG